MLKFKINKLYTAATVYTIELCRGRKCIGLITKYIRNTENEIDLELWEKITLTELDQIREYINK